MARVDDSPVLARAKSIIAVVLTVGVIAHFLAVIAYLLPVTPAKLVYERVVTPLIASYADQQWSLFAPNPAKTNTNLLVKCVDADENLLLTSGADGLSSDGWHDLTAPLIQAHQRARFSPYDRIARTQSSHIVQFL